VDRDRGGSGTIRDHGMGAGLCGFFLPLAGSVLELSSRYPQEGGLYIWTREAYGEFAGFMAAWTYWMSNLPYFPAVLYFAASSMLFTTPRAAHLADANMYFCSSPSPC